MSGMSGVKILPKFAISPEELTSFSNRLFDAASSPDTGSTSETRVSILRPNGSLVTAEDNGAPDPNNALVPRVPVDDVNIRNYRRLYARSLYLTGTAVPVIEDKIRQAVDAVSESMSRGWASRNTDWDTVFELDENLTERNGGEPVWRNLTTGGNQWGSPMRLIYQNKDGYWIIDEAGRVDRNSQGKFRARSKIIDAASPSKTVKQSEINPDSFPDVAAMQKRTLEIENRMDEALRLNTDLPELVEAGTWEIRSDRSGEIANIDSKFQRLVDREDHRREMEDLRKSLNTTGRASNESAEIRRNIDALHKKIVVLSELIELDEKPEGIAEAEKKKKLRELTGRYLSLLRYTGAGAGEAVTFPESPEKRDEARLDLELTRQKLKKSMQSRTSSEESKSNAMRDIIRIEEKMAILQEFKELSEVRVVSEDDDRLERAANLAKEYWRLDGKPEDLERHWEPARTVMVRVNPSGADKIARQIHMEYKSIIDDYLEELVARGKKIEDLETSLRDETAEAIQRKEELEKHERARASRALHVQKLEDQEMAAKNQADAAARVEEGIINALGNDHKEILMEMVKEEMLKRKNIEGDERKKIEEEMEKKMKEEMKEKILKEMKRRAEEQLAKLKTELKSKQKELAEKYENAWQEYIFQKSNQDLKFDENEDVKIYESDDSSCQPKYGRIMSSEGNFYKVMMYLDSDLNPIEEKEVDKVPFENIYRFDMDDMLDVALKLQESTNETLKSSINLYDEVKVMGFQNREPKVGIVLDTFFAPEDIDHNDELFVVAVEGVIEGDDNGDNRKEKGVIYHGLPRKSLEGQFNGQKYAKLIENITKLDKEKGEPIEVMPEQFDDPLKEMQKILFKWKTAGGEKDSEGDDRWYFGRIQQISKNSNEISEDDKIKISFECQSTKEQPKKGTKWFPMNHDSPTLKTYQLEEKTTQVLRKDIDWEKALYRVANKAVNDESLQNAKCKYEIEQNKNKDKETIEPIECFKYYEDNKDIDFSDNFMWRLWDFALKTGCEVSKKDFKGGTRKGERRYTKVAEDYQGQWQNLADLERATAIYADPHRMTRALIRLLTPEKFDLGFKVIRSKDRINTPLTGGDSLFISAATTAGYPVALIPDQLKVFIKKLIEIEESLQQEFMNKSKPFSEEEIKAELNTILLNNENEDHRIAHYGAMIPGKTGVNDDEFMLTRHFKEKLKSRETSYVSEEVNSPLSSYMKQLWEENMQKDWEEAWKATFNKEMPPTEIMKEKGFPAFGGQVDDNKTSFLARYYCKNWLFVREGNFLCPEVNNKKSKWVHAYFGHCDERLSRLQKKWEILLEVKLKEKAKDEKTGEVKDEEVMTNVAQNSTLFGSLDEAYFKVAEELAKTIDGVEYLADAKDCEKISETDACEVRVVGKNGKERFEKATIKKVMEDEKNYEVEFADKTSKKVSVDDIRVKVELSAMFSGYRDIQLNIEHDRTGFVGELQLSLRTLSELKKDSHAIYDFERIIDPGSPQKSQHTDDSEKNEITELVDRELANLDKKNMEHEEKRNRERENVIRDIIKLHCEKRTERRRTKKRAKRRPTNLLEKANPKTEMKQEFNEAELELLQSKSKEDVEIFALDSIVQLSCAQENIEQPEEQRKYSERNITAALDSIVGLNIDLSTKSPQNQIHLRSDALKKGISYHDEKIQLLKNQVDEELKQLDSEAQHKELQSRKEEIEKRIALHESKKNQLASMNERIQGYPSWLDQVAEEKAKINEEVKILQKEWEDKRAVFEENAQKHMKQQLDTATSELEKLKPQLEQKKEETKEKQIELDSEKKRLEEEERVLKAAHQKKEKDMNQTLEETKRKLEKKEKELQEMTIKAEVPCKCFGAACVVS